MREPAAHPRQQQQQQPVARRRPPRSGRGRDSSAAGGADTRAAALRRGPCAPGHLFHQRPAAPPPILPLHSFRVSSVGFLGLDTQAKACLKHDSRSAGAAAEAAVVGAGGTEQHGALLKSSQRRECVACPVRDRGWVLAMRTNADGASGEHSGGSGRQRAQACRRLLPLQLAPRSALNCAQAEAFPSSRKLCLDALDQPLRRTGAPRSAWVPN